MRHRSQAFVPAGRQAPSIGDHSRVVRVSQTRPPRIGGVGPQWNRGRGEIATPAAVRVGGRALRLGLCLTFALGIPSLAPASQGGYASKVSVAQGESIDLHISTRTPDFRLSIYREGEPRQLMQRFEGLNAVDSPCDEPGYEAGCDWPVTVTLDIPQDWPSGVYTGKFPIWEDGGDSRALMFIVREDQPGSTSKILAGLPTNTYQSYNNFGGKSFYESNSSDEERAFTISFDRPYNRYGDGGFFRDDLYFVRWADQQGYAVEYCSNTDLHRDSELLSNYTLYISLGHDEYWSRDMRDHLDAFTGSGGNAMILSGNTCYRQVRYSEDLRQIACYKENALREDPLALDGDPSNDHLIATEFSRSPVDYPPNLTIGLGWRHGGYHNRGAAFPAENGFGGYRVYRTEHWIFRGTSLTDGEMIGQEATIVGYEVDGTLLEARDGDGNVAWDAEQHYPLPGALPYLIDTEISKTPENFEILGLAPATSGYGVMGLYETAGGGRVFNAGTIDWSKGLESDAAVDRITSNVIDSFVEGDRIVELSATPETVRETETSLLVADVLSTHVGALSYEWVVPPDGGSVDDANSATTLYTAPEVDLEQTIVLTVRIDDGLLETTHELGVTVEPAPVPVVTNSMGAAPASIVFSGGAQAIAFSGSMSCSAPDLSLRGATFRNRGGGDADALVQRATLYVDANADGQLDDDDQIVGEAVFGAGGVLAFENLSVELDDASGISYLLVFDLNPESSQRIALVAGSSSCLLLALIVVAIVGVVVLRRRTSAANLAPWLLIVAFVGFVGCGGGGGGGPVEAPSPLAEPTPAPDPAPDPAPAPEPSPAPRDLQLELIDVDVRNEGAEPCAVEGLPLMAWSFEA